MTVRRPNSAGASPARLAEWQTRRLTTLRAAPGPSWHEALPLDLLADPEQTRRILDQLRVMTVTTAGRSPGLRHRWLRARTLRQDTQKPEQP